MRNSSRAESLVTVVVAALAGVLATAILIGAGVIASALGVASPAGSVEPPRVEIEQPASPKARNAPKPTAPAAPAAPAAPVAKAPAAKTPKPSPTPPVTPPVTLPAPVSATGNIELDSLLTKLPPVLFAAGARVHFGYNPIDCCHAGGYNPEPNEVWVSERALTSTARLTYVAVHELAHSVHLRSDRGAALTAAVAGAPVARAGSPWDVSEKVADCVAWVLFPAETAASGITYWSCPDPWRSQVAAALA